MARRDHNFNIESLADLFNDAFSLILQLRQLRDFGDPGELRRQMKSLFVSAESRARRLDVNPRDVEDAKYAVVAFLDEVVLNSDWSYRDDWSSQPLQLEYFGTNLAGEEFFTRLDGLMKEQPGRGELLEVYFFCLALGFEGRYRVLGKERLRGLIADVQARLQALRGGSSALAPHWKPEKSGRMGAVAGIPVYLIPLLGIAGLVLILLLLDTLLGEELASLI